MAKKSRKTKPIYRTGSTPIQKAGQKQSVETSIPANVTRKTVSSPSSVIQQPANYSYVKSDLVQIGIIASVLVLIIIVLTFIPALR